MGDAKTAVKTLFEMIAAEHKKGMIKNQELETKYVELMVKIMNSIELLFFFYS